MGKMTWVNFALRILQLIFATIIMGLIGNMIDDADHGSASTVNYSLFVPAFTLLTLFYLIPATFWEKIMMHPAIMLGVDVFNLIFTFCAAVALPSKLHAKSCTNKEYTSSNSITRGSPFPEKRCREAQASSAFFWFLWFTFLLTTIFSGLAISNRYSGGGRTRRRASRGHPSMSQV